MTGEVNINSSAGLTSPQSFMAGLLQCPPTGLFLASRFAHPAYTWPQN